MTSFTYSDELYHHGILGQKWGVRRYQNDDGSYTEEGKTRRKILQKGQTLYRISTKAWEPTDSNRKYVSTTEKGKDFWNDFFNKESQKKHNWYSLEYKTMKDIEVADATESGKKFYEMCKDHGFYQQAYMDVYYHGAISKKRQEEISSDVRDHGDFTAPLSYEEFSTQLGWWTDSSKKFFDEMKNVGYGAVEDYYGRMDGAKDAFIILDPEKTIRKTKVSQIT